MVVAVFLLPAAAKNPTNGSLCSYDPSRCAPGDLTVIHPVREHISGRPRVRYSVEDRLRPKDRRFTYQHGAIVRGDRSKREIALVFTGDEFADGGRKISNTLKRQSIHGSFFLTGNFYRNKAFLPLVQTLQLQGNYLGAHSDRHLLYCQWSNRDSLLVTRSQFREDLGKNLHEMQGLGTKHGRYFLPPFEWYNDSIADWTKEMGMQLVNYSPGTLSTADYTYPGLANYRSADEIYSSITRVETEDPDGLNGFILLVHIGTDPRRTDKFYHRLDKLISLLKNKGYSFKKIDELLAS